MKKSTRQAFARLSFLLCTDDCGTPRLCACHRPQDRRLTPEQRKALDDLEEAMANEPDDAEPAAAPDLRSWIPFVEID